MKRATKDQLAGKFHEAKGTVKEAAGRIAHNVDLLNEGQAEKFAGKIQKKLGQLERVLET